MSDVINIKTFGQFLKTKKRLKKTLRAIDGNLMEQYGKEGVRALQSATPKDTGETANSWYYNVDLSINGRAKLSFHNSHIEDGCQIAIILQYGHASRDGSWVEGVDYINPALRPIFDNLAYKMWKEVVS